jgi:hypothetical protein
VAAALATAAAAAQQHDRGVRQTPRGQGLAAAAAAASSLAGVSSSLSIITSSLHAVGAHAAARPAGQEGVEVVRQQLRLLRILYLQLKHLNARMETALQAKKEKVTTYAQPGFL